MWNNLVKFLSKPITAKGIGKRQEQKPAPKPQPKKIPSQQPVPRPTPFQSPAQGGNPNIVPGTTGQSISQNDQPIATLANGSVLWASGKTTPRTSVQQTSPVKIPMSSQTDPRAENYQPQQSQASPSGQQINYGGQTPTGGAAEVIEDPANAILQQAQDYVTTIFDLLNQGNLDVSNPFALDEVLARNAAVQSISPYYAELYGRFRKAVDLDKLLGQGKAQRGLQELQQGGENYQTKLQRLLQLGQQQTGEQFAGQGLYESGGRQRAQGLQNVTAKQDLQSYMQGQQRQVQGVKAQEEDLLNRLLLQKQEKESQLASAQRTDVESAVQEAQRVAQSRQGIAALEGQPLTGENLPEYFKRRGTALSQFLPSQSYS